MAGPFVAPQILAQDADTRLGETIRAQVADEARRYWAASGEADIAPHIRLEWPRQVCGFRIRHERRIDYDPAGRISLLEFWRLPADRLDRFLRMWGHTDPPAWEELTGEIFGGMIMASRKRGTLVIVREGADVATLWDLPPFPLESLTPLDSSAFTDMAPLEEGRKFWKMVGGEVRELVSEIVIDELQDIRGVPLSASVSNTWEFKIGDFKPRLRIQRRVRMEDDETFTVVDSIEGDIDLILGYLGERATSGFFINTKRRIVFFREGYTKWYRAVFAYPFDPRRLPWSVSRLRRLPEGVRLVFPATTGLFVGEDRIVKYLRDQLPLGDSFKIGFRGTFFLSMTRLPGNRLNLRFGGRVERVAFFRARVRFDKRFNLDPRRLLGDLAKLRLEAIRGARLFYECTLDLESDEEAEKALLALREGLKVSGYRLGGAAIGDFFFFMGKVDQRTLDKVITKHLPDFQWDYRVDSRYLSGNWYGRLDLKLASIMRSKTSLDDRWTGVDLAADEKLSGSSGRIVYRAQERFMTRRDKKRIEVHFLSSRGRNDTIPLASYVEIFFERREKRTTRREMADYLRMTRNDVGMDILGDARFPGVVPGRRTFANMDYRWHLVLERRALDKIAERVLSVPNMPDGSLLKILARRHPYHFWRVRRAAAGDVDKRDTRLAHFLMGMLRWRRPSHFFITRLPPMSYLFEWNISAADLPAQQGSCGGCAVPAEMRLAWRAWERLTDYDDLFEDLDLREQ